MYNKNMTPLRVMDWIPSLNVTAKSLGVAFLVCLYLSSPVQCFIYFFGTFNLLYITAYIWKETRDDDSTASPTPTLPGSGPRHNAQRALPGWVRKSADSFAAAHPILPAASVLVKIKKQGQMLEKTMQEVRATQKTHSRMLNYHSSCLKKHDKVIEKNQRYLILAFIVMIGMGCILHRLVVFVESQHRLI